MSSRDHVPRLAVLISGGGRTLVNLQERIARGLLRAEIAMVIASRETDGVRRAKELGLHVVVSPGRIPRGMLEGLLRAHRIDWVVLAGYLHLLDIPEAY